MRNNQPVTSDAYVVPADQTLVSITDLQGRITYCNPSFVAVSGYEPSELLGQPHNLVRHPDMPEEAFRDLWATIQSGRPWTALVKNRRKNGDFYWVRAHATPVRDGDRTVGYLSVRTAPDEAEVRHFEQLYARMRAEAAAGRRVHVLSQGRVRRNDGFGRLAERLRPELTGRIIALTALATAGPLLAGWAGAPPAALLLAALASGGTASVGLVASLVRPLRGVIATANLLAAGDLTRSVHAGGPGEIGALQLALSQLAVSVRTVVRDVRNEVARLRDGAGEISAGNQDLSARTDAQASSLEQTAAAMDQIGGTVGQTAELAGEGAGLARDTLAMAEHCQQAVHGVATTMREIAESSRHMGDIIQVIEGVSFQTNMLALNAAVEAARAGAQGRGFAVVAGEVRSLAQRTGSAAKEIRALIGDSQRRVDAGGQRADEARQRMDEVTAAVLRVSEVLQQIDGAAHEQSIGVGQVGEAVQQLDSITQQNAAMVEQLTAAAGALRSQVGRVHDSLRVFRLTGGDRSLAEVDAVALRRRTREQGS